MIEAHCTGRLTKAIEVKTSKNGNPYARLSLRLGDGEGATYLNATVFGDTATTIANQAEVGSQVTVTGKLTMDSWEGRDGGTRHGLSIAAWSASVAPIGRNKPKAAGEAPTSGRTSKSQPAPAYDSGAQFNDGIGF